MSLYEQIDKQLAKIEIEKTIRLVKPQSKPTASFRSTIYNVLKARGLKCKVNSSSEEVGLVFTITLQTQEFVQQISSASASKNLSIRSTKLSIQLIAASAVFISEGLISAVEFVGAEQGEIESLAQGQVELEDYEIVDTGVGYQIKSKTEV